MSAESARRSEPLITVLDFDTREVRKITPKQWKQEQDEGCRSQGHMFVTRWPDVPMPGDRCICGDIDYSEWKRP